MTDALLSTERHKNLWIFRYASQRNVGPLSTYAQGYYDPESQLCCYISSQATGVNLQ